jgi:glycerol-3-phosphate acyltransferase PlsY
MVLVIVVFLHRGNIVRLAKGQEPVFKPKSQK